MPKTIYGVSVNPFGIGEQFEQELEAHDNAQEALDCMMEDTQITSMTLLRVRRLLKEHPTATLHSLGYALHITGLPQDALEEAIESGILHEIEDHPEDDEGNDPSGTFQ